MGDMADYYLDRDSIEDADAWENFQGERPRVCEYCGAGPLWWRMTSGGWRLFTRDGHMHTCRAYQEQHGRRCPWCGEVEAYPGECLDEADSPAADLRDGKD